MIERKWKLKDVKEFLKQRYNLEWRHFHVVKDGGQICGVGKTDFNGDKLKVLAILHKGDRRQLHWLCVSNQVFKTSIESEPQSDLWAEMLANKSCQQVAK